MTRTQYRAAIERLGLSIVGAAKVLGVSRRQAQRFASGESPVPEPVAKLLRLMIKHNVDPDEVSKR